VIICRIRAFLSFPRKRESKKNVDARLKHAGMTLPQGAITSKR